MACLLFNNCNYKRHCTPRWNNYLYMYYKKILHFKLKLWTIVFKQCDNTTFMLYIHNTLKKKNNNQIKQINKCLQKLKNIDRLVYGFSRDLTKIKSKQALFSNKNAHKFHALITSFNKIKSTNNLRACYYSSLVELVILGTRNRS